MGVLAAVKAARNNIDTDALNALCDEETVDTGDDIIVKQRR